LPRPATVDWRVAEEIYVTPNPARVEGIAAAATLDKPTAVEKNWMVEI